MKKVKSLISCIFIIILFALATFGSVLIFSLLFQARNGINSSELSNYVSDMAQFFSDYQLLIVAFSAILVLPFIYTYFRKHSINISFKKSTAYFYWILLGISFGLVGNILFYDFALMQEVNYSSVIAILSTAVLGPILEECIFRGVVYNKLKSSFSVKTAFILTSILFSVYHFNVVQGIYTFFFSMLITYVYEKSDNLLGAILVHCSGNLAVSIILPFLLRQHFIVIQIILLICMLLGVFTLKKYCLSHMNKS